MDPLVLIDAIAICMAYEEKELCKIGEVALAVIFDVASIILGSKERVILCIIFLFRKNVWLNDLVSDSWILFLKFQKIPVSWQNKLKEFFFFQACQLPLFSYIVERLCACCYEQAWYAKLGGVVSIKFLMERLPLIWVLQNQQTFLKALLFVMMDLTGEVKDECIISSNVGETSFFFFLIHTNWAFSDLDFT